MSSKIHCGGKLLTYFRELSSLKRRRSEFSDSWLGRFCCGENSGFFTSTGINTVRQATVDITEEEEEY